MRDALDEFEAYDARVQKKLDRLPICKICGDPIMQETAVYMNGWICDDCLDDFRQNVEEDYDGYYL